MAEAKACQVITVCCWLHNKAMDYGYELDLDMDNADNQQPDEPQDPLVHTMTERQSSTKGKAARIRLIQHYFNRPRSL